MYLDPGEKQLSSHVEMTRQYEGPPKSSKKKDSPPYTEKELKKKIQEIKGIREKAYVKPAFQEGWRERLPDATQKFEKMTEKWHKLQPYVIGGYFLFSRRFNVTGRITALTTSEVKVQLFFRFASFFFFAPLSLLT